MGHVFVLHRDTGAPLFPVEERAVPKSTVPGEEASPTQPFPIRPRALVPARLTADDAWGLSPDERDACRAWISRLRSEGIFTPPSFEGTVIFPGYAGGANWGSVSHDPVRGLLIAATNRLAFVVTLVPRDQLPAGARATAARPGREFAPQRGTPYGMYREALVSPGGLPCNPPPWGALTAVDLATGDVRWEVPLGTSPELPTIPGLSQLWRRPHHRERTDLHRRGARHDVAGLRHRDRNSALERRAAGERAGDADDVPLRRAANSSS